MNVSQLKQISWIEKSIIALDKENHCEALNTSPKQST